MLTEQMFTVGLLLFTARFLWAFTRDGQCESLPAVEVSADGFSLSGSIYQLVPDRLPGSPFAVFHNHTPYGYCLRAHLDWTPNHINITLVCDCPESAGLKPMAPDVQDLQGRTTPGTRLTLLQLVYVRANKFAVVYGCHDNGNSTVSEGVLMVGRTVRHVEDYLQLYQSAVYSPLWPQHKRLHQTTQLYTMSYSRTSTPGCNYRHEFYQDRGLTKANVTLVVVIVLMASALMFSLCVRCCLRRFASPRLVTCSL